jgi:hypothetical protein
MMSRAELIRLPSCCAVVSGVWDFTVSVWEG